LSIALVNKISTPPFSFFLPFSAELEFKLVDSFFCHFVLKHQVMLRKRKSLTWAIRFLVAKYRFLVSGWRNNLDGNA
jgi:hypothetical protein